MWLIQDFASSKSITLELVWMHYKLRLFHKLMPTRDLAEQVELVLEHATDYIQIQFLDKKCLRIISQKYNELTYPMLCFY